MNYLEREKICRKLFELIREEKIFNYHELVDKTLEMDNPRYFLVVSQDAFFLEEYIKSFKRATEEKERKPQPISPEDCFFR